MTGKEYFCTQNSVQTTNMVHIVQVALLEDHPVFRSGVKMALAPICHVAVEAKTGEDLLKRLPGSEIDVAIIDLILPGMSGVEVVEHLRRDYPDVKILIFSVDTREEVFQRLLELGIDGFLGKTASEERLQEAVSTIMSGEKYFSRPERVLEREILVSMKSRRHESLSDREQDIMLALCKGMSCNEIAEQMYVSPKTVDNHKQHIFAKLGIHNVVQLVTYAVRNKIIVLS